MTTGAMLFHTATHQSSVGVPDHHYYYNSQFPSYYNYSPANPRATSTVTRTNNPFCSSYQSSSPPAQATPAIFVPPRSRAAQASQKYNIVPHTFAPVRRPSPNPPMASSPAETNGVAASSMIANTPEGKVWSPTFDCDDCDRARVLLSNGVDPRTIFVDEWCRQHVPRCCTCNSLLRAKKKGTDCKRNDKLMCLHKNKNRTGQDDTEEDALHLCCCKSSHFKEWMENSRKYYLR